MMKRILKLILSMNVLMLIFSNSVFATSRVQFEGGAENFVFYHDGNWTNTDLFGGFKNIMPGDKRTEEIVVKNVARDYDYVKIYLRANPISDGNSSVEGVSMREFLAQLTMNVYQDGKLISSAAASETAGLTENVLLGTFYPGDDTRLTTEIIAPASLGSQYMHAYGEIDWVFHAEAYKDGKIVSPDTGGFSGSLSADAIPAIIIAVAGAVILALVVILPRRRREK